MPGSREVNGSMKDLPREIESKQVLKFFLFGISFEVRILHIWIFVVLNFEPPTIGDSKPKRTIVF